MLFTNTQTEPFVEILGLVYRRGLPLPHHSYLNWMTQQKLIDTQSKKERKRWAEGRAK